MTNEYFSLANVWRITGNTFGQASLGSDLEDRKDQAKKSVLRSESFCRVE